MSATIPNAVGHRLQTTSLTGISAGSSVLIMAWLLRANVDPTVSIALGMELNEGGGNNTSPSLRTRVQWNGVNPVAEGIINISTALTSSGAAILFDTWYHHAVWYGGWTGSSNAAQSFVNGVLRATVNVSSNFATTSLAGLCLLDRFTGSGGGHWRGRIAEVAVYSNITTAQRDEIIAQAQTRHVGALSITPNFAWRLLSSGNAAVGGVNLSAVGTVTYDAEQHPPVGEGTATIRRRVVWIG